MIFSVIFLLGVIRAFTWPSIFALTPRIIERSQFAVAQTWQSATYQVAAVSGPALGGIIYAWKGPAAAYALDLGLIAVTVATTFLIKVGDLSTPRDEKSREHHF